MGNRLPSPTERILRFGWLRFGYLARRSQCSAESQIPWQRRPKWGDEVGGTNRGVVACARLVSAPSGELISAPPLRTVKHAHYTTMSSDIECDILSGCYATATAKVPEMKTNPRPTTRQASNLNPVILCGSISSTSCASFCQFSASDSQKARSAGLDDFSAIRRHCSACFLYCSATDIFTHTVSPSIQSLTIISDRGGYVADATSGIPFGTAIN